MASKRPRPFRLRRPAGSFWIGQTKPADPDDDPQRISLFLTGHQLDLAQKLANAAGISTIQAFCTRLLVAGLEAERTRLSLEETEARRGPLHGWNAIADDPEYLAEWRTANRNSVAQVAQVALNPVEPEPIAMSIEDPAAEVVLRHAGHSDANRMGFLACLRRGESPTSEALNELNGAIRILEEDSQEATAIDRRLAFALHRLAFESQILHTDAWPGAFDEWTIQAIRNIQEAVERVLSGQDIRYGTEPRR